MKKFILLCLLSVGMVNAQIIQLVDSYSKENVNFKQIDSLPVGIIADGIIYGQKKGKFYKRVYNDKINASWFGVDASDNIDDTNAVQKALNFAIKEGSSIIFPNGKIIISSTIVLSTYRKLKQLEIDFNNSEIFLTSDISFLRSSNYGSVLDTDFNQGIFIKNFNVNANGIINSPAIKLQDYHQGCKIENVSSNITANIIYLNNCYYIFLENIQTQTIENTNGPRFIFENDSNLCDFTRLMVGNSEIGLEFRNAVTALSLNNLSLEGVGTGIVFKSQVYNAALRDSYCEAFTLLVSFENYVNAFSFDNNYINFAQHQNSKIIKYLPSPLNYISFKEGNNITNGTIGNIMFNKEDDYGKGININLPQYIKPSSYVQSDYFGANFKVIFY